MMIRDFVCIRYRVFLPSIFSSWLAESEDQEAADTYDWLCAHTPWLFQRTPRHQFTQRGLKAGPLGNSPGALCHLTKVSWWHHRPPTPAELLALQVCAASAFPRWSLKAPPSDLSTPHSFRLWDSCPLPSFISHLPAPRPPHARHQHLCPSAFLQHPCALPCTNILGFPQPVHPKAWLHVTSSPWSVILSSLGGTTFTFPVTQFA